MVCLFPGFFFRSGFSVQFFQQVLHRFAAVRAAPEAHGAAQRHIPHHGQGHVLGDRFLRGFLTVLFRLFMAEDFHGLCFVNLVDFDSAYGHRNDPAGYGKALTQFDTWLGNFLDLLREDDMLIITAAGYPNVVLTTEAIG